MVEVVFEAVLAAGKDTSVDWEGGMRLEIAVLICKEVDIRCCNGSGDLVLAMTLDGEVCFGRVLLMAVEDVVDVVGDVAAVAAAVAVAAGIVSRSAVWMFFHCLSLDGPEEWSHVDYTISPKVVPQASEVFPQSASYLHYFAFCVPWAFQVASHQFCRYPIVKTLDLNL